MVNCWAHDVTRERNVIVSSTTASNNHEPPVKRIRPLVSEGLCRLVAYRLINRWSRIFEKPTLQPSKPPQRARRIHYVRGPDFGDVVCQGGIHDGIKISQPS